MYHHSEAGIELPHNIGSFKEGEIGSYSTSSGQTGIAIPHHAPDAQGTVFISAPSNLNSKIPVNPFSPRDLQSESLQKMNFLIISERIEI